MCLAVLLLLFSLWDRLALQWRFEIQVRASHYVTALKTTNLLAYAMLHASVTGAADADTLKPILLQVQDSSPCVLAFVDRAYPDKIMIAHVPRVF